MKKYVINNTISSWNFWTVRQSCISSCRLIKRAENDKIFCAFPSFNSDTKTCPKNKNFKIRYSCMARCQKCKIVTFSFFIYTNQFILIISRLFSYKSIFQYSVDFNPKDIYHLLLGYEFSYWKFLLKIHKLLSAIDRHNKIVSSMYTKMKLSFS